MKINLKGCVIYSKLKNINLLVASDNVKKNKKALKYSSYFNKITIIDSNGFLKFYIDNYNKIDIVLLDIDHFKYINFEKISSICSNQQFIFLSYKRKNYIDILKNFNCGNSAILFKPIKFRAILDNISMLIPDVKTNEILTINKNIKIDIKKEIVYKDNKAIYLTHNLHKLLLLFLANLDKIITFYAIEDVIYDGKSVNRYVIQNLVGLLKRELDLNIKNVYGKGYILHKNKEGTSS